jgi:hypothetical protein
MTTDTGARCLCTGCGEPQWYDHGLCVGCGTDKNIDYTWVVGRGALWEAPARTFELEEGASRQLVEIWTNFILLRGLSPYFSSGAEALVQFSSPGWYMQRAVSFSVRCAVPVDSTFFQDLNRASTWTNQSLLVRILATLEAFAGENIRDFRLPSKPGMRELHYARRLRNKIAHGKPLTSESLLEEARQLFGAGGISDGSCNLAIDVVLEPLWARLRIYAGSVEKGITMPDRPGVVVTVHDGAVVAQAFEAQQQTLAVTSGRRIGDIVALPDMP